ncbi:hypothetical protein FocnCong_v021747 [Fusarium oxysporum f. sp. conglutinans]|nr:hypothetical protein FocnCong_v021747 [Fusarium oxysporum f. sp. conglutinans]
MLDEQMRAAGDPVLQRLLKRIRLGVQDGTDLDLLNSRCYQEDRRIPWETGITVVTPLNRNRWNLNMEASLAFQVQQRSMMRIFISEHKWKDGLPMEEEAIMMLSQGDDSAIPVPAIFMAEVGQRCQLHGGGGHPRRDPPGASDLGRRDDPLRAAGRDITGVGDDKGPPLRRDAARHDLVDADERQDTLPTKAAVAKERRQPKGSALCSSFCVHRLQGAEQDARARSAGVARDADNKCRRTRRPLAVRPVQPVRAAVALPDAGRHHARVQGAGERPGGQQGPRRNDCRAGETGETERQDGSRGVALV